MSNFLSVPHKETNPQAHMVYMLVVIWSIIIVSIESFGFYFFPEQWLRWVFFIIVAVFVFFLNLQLNYRGYTKTASWCFVSMLWLSVTLSAYNSGGIMALGILIQISVILTAGFLLGWRGGMVIGLLSVAADFVFVYLEIKGLLPASVIPHTPLTRWIGSIIPFGSILALQYYSTNHLRSALHAMQREIGKREEAEKQKDQLVYNLKERVKELKCLYTVSNILQDESTPVDILYQRVADAIPAGWQFEHCSAASIQVGDAFYSTANYASVADCQQSHKHTAKGLTVAVKVVYLQPMPVSDEGLFLKEERQLIEMLADMLKTDMERRERRTELEEYKFALDEAASVSVTDTAGRFIFVNDNFCKLSKYSRTELLAAKTSLLLEGLYTDHYLQEVNAALQSGKPFRAEFCQIAKDRTHYWTDTTVIPFLDNHGKPYQYLTIYQDITERKTAEASVKKSEHLLRKLTSQVPANTYMFEIDESGTSKVLFMNRGTDRFNHHVENEDLAKQPSVFRDMIHEDDKKKFNDKFAEAYRLKAPISFQYRIIVDEQIRWRWMQAIPEKEADGRFIWYGATSDITPIVEYIASVEQILFDIAHVMRRPITSLMGLSQLMEEEGLDKLELRDLSKKIYAVSAELDRFTRELNNAYVQKRKNSEFDIDASVLIDKRRLFF